MVAREMAGQLLEMAKYMPVLVITGPRQSGKTTLVKAVFPEYFYVNLELISEREFAQSDPQGFFSRFGQSGLIIDEAQYVPELFSYIQVLADESKQNGRFILSGSQNFNLMQSVSQSLAGRAIIFHLLPFSMNELQGTVYSLNHYEEALFKGFYPRIYDSGVPVFQYYQSYLQTYAERDVRQIIQVKDLNKFSMLLKLLSGRIGQLLNMNSLSADLGVDSKTVKSWISILETGYIVKLLYPYHKNFGKRLVKTPKLYFYDTGLACNLLGIASAGQLQNHYLRGELFENMILMELMKNYYNRGIYKTLYFWRDSNGNEVDIILEENEGLVPIEIKSGQTINAVFFKGLNQFVSLTENIGRKPVLIYGGQEYQQRSQADIFGWNRLSEFFK